GTDCPWADQKAYVDAFRELPFTEEEQNAILGKNALKLLEMEVNS
ncbi:MAG TPA: metal-dependent hydrolase, partial [Lachnospiraceae bacterium]|nr:metal-dependent hydrolase [Lachnospiraceae bacterium]